MKTAILDFESYYDKEVSVVTQGLPNYIRDADAYIVGVLMDGEAACGTLKEMSPMMEQLAGDDTVQPVAANSNFDQAWFEKYWKPFKQDWHCILDQAAGNQYPRNVSSLYGALFGTKADKTVRDEMKGKRYEDLTAGEREEVTQYCLDDVIHEQEILDALPSLSPVEEKIAAHTRMVNRRGVHINRDLVEADKQKLELMRFNALQEIPWSKDVPPLSYPALLKFCSRNNIPAPKSTAKTDGECAELMSEHPQLHQVLSAMRRFRRANTMLKKVETLMQRLTDDDILPLDLLYCGAPHTRRWSSKGFNVQNLDKEPLVIAEDISVWTRNWLIPRAGCEFLILDLAQIEPRCLNWLAENEEMLAALRKGYSIYEAFIIAFEGWRGEPGTLKQSLGKAKYTLLKNRVLGLGYGMGAPKFCDYVRTNGGEITEDESCTIVDGFRKSNRKIVKLWGKMDGLIKSAARTPERALELEMPAGGVLRHFRIRASKTGYESYTVRGDAKSRQPCLWGGTLTENITQRMARDVLAEAIIRLESAGFPVVFHCHDEVILEIPKPASDKQRSELKTEALRLLTQSPEWASDLPLGAEGDFAMAYTK